MFSEKKFSPRTVIAHVVLAFTGATALGGCAQFEDHIPKCDPAVETVSVDEARKAYTNPQSSVNKGGFSKNKSFAWDLKCMDCKNQEGERVVIKNIAEKNGAVFEEKDTPESQG